jgi:uncharacterized repeat protein (TIGR04076 family)
MGFDVEITVLEKNFNQEYIDKYTDDPSSWVPCEVFNVGQKFTVKADNPWNMPDGFCGWAWADIQKIVYGMSRGSRKLFVISCTDGYRPVIFKLNAIPQKYSL